MRPTLRADNPTELLALRLNLAPVAVGEAMFSQPLARSVIAGVRLGLFACLARAPATHEELAADLETVPAATRLLLESLAAAGHVRRDGDRYELARRARRWLDPASETYVGTFIENCGDYWDWWDRLEEIVRTGEAVEIHEYAPDHPHWRRYIRGQFEIARLSSREVAKALRLQPDPTALLDVAGGHGWYSAELCRRHPTLRATVVDLEGSAAVGREIIAEHGMSDRVSHVVGDMMSADLGGPYDGTLCFNIVHHLPPEGNVELLRRIHSVLRPGGTVAVLDLFLPERNRRPDTGAFLGLFFYLTSAAATYTEAELEDWLRAAGFERPRRVKLRRIPNQALFEARKPG
jgi:2-polyprenyl-3-methyl-5-hydroxy-6-metoxy-1,4-benzoquinol methylase